MRNVFNMNTSELAQRLAFEDLVGELCHARRTGDLGRIALLVYWGLRRWARNAGKHNLATRANDLFLAAPFPDRESFLREVDELIAEAEGELCQLGQIVVAPGFLSSLDSAKASSQVPAGR
jgi:hypothetical protein